MFKHIMVPMDLAHRDRLDRARACAADLARHFDASVTYVGVTSHNPGSVARTAEEYKRKLGEFAQSEAESHGITADAHMEITSDPIADVDDALMRAIKTTGADLVVMATHPPSITDYIMPSNGGKIAEHAKCSVMVVRD